MYFTDNDITIYYEKYGNSKENIIILPGWGDNRLTYSYMINYLKEYFTIYILDYPGFGKSPFPNKDLTIYDYSNLIYEWIKSLNITNPTLISHSFGGRIVTTLLGYYNYKFKNIIYMNSAGIKHKKNLKQKAKTISYKLLMRITNLFPNNLKEKTKNYLFNKYASNDYKNLNTNMRKTFKNIVNEDLLPYIKNIKTKVLIIWGNNDKQTPIKDAYTMKKLIKNSELIVIDKSEHFTYLDQPYLINKIILTQIKSE